MNSLAKRYPAILSPARLVFMWLAVTTILGLLSGWYGLMYKYPNREEEALLKVKRQSGSMGTWVHMRGVLNLSVCPSGLRVGITRIFGLFCRDFFVPWEEISVTRKNRFLWQTAELQFGNPPAGRLSVASYIANRLAGSALGRWPEPGPFPQETNSQVAASILKIWAAETAVAALFFIVVPRIVAPRANVPIMAAILLPAVVYGIANLFQFFSRTKRAPVAK